MEQKDVLLKQAKIHDSFYLYDENGITESINCLKQNFPWVDFLYSIKCNSNTHVVKSIFAQGFGADAASLGEVLLASEAGLPREKIYYSAPGKTVKDIEKSIMKCILVADSVDEIKRIQETAEKMGAVIVIGIRINPDFTFYGSCGQPSKFGIDEDQALDFIRNNQFKNIKIRGLHVHLKSQELNAEVLADYYRKMFQLAEKFWQACGGLDFVNLGSGMGIPYSKGDTPLDMPCLGAAVKEAFEAFCARYPDTKLMIETGRYVVGKSGVYVTRVLDRKVSHEKTYLILKNTLNGFIRPSLARLVMHYSSEGDPTGSEPLFTSADAFEFLALKESQPLETVTLVGNLCTAADVIAKDIRMPHLECGDPIVITNAGSYGAVLSPMQFSAQEKPAELFLTANGEIL